MCHRIRVTTWVAAVSFGAALGCGRSPNPVQAAPAQRPARAVPGPSGERSGFTLANGLRVRLVPSRDDDQVIVLLGVRAGFFDEPPSLPHVAHVTEHVTVFSAAPGSEEAKAVARWYGGGKANAETLADFMYFDLHVPPAELTTALRVQAARLTGADLSRAVLEREVPRALAELEFLEKSEQGGTFKFALCPFVQAALHGRTEVSLKSGTRGLTIEQVREFHRQHFRPDRAMLVVIGAFDPAEARKAVETIFGTIPRPADDRRAPRPRLAGGPVAARWDARTRHVVVGWPAPPAAQPDHAALSLAALVLTQRLFTDRETTALAKLPLASNDVEGVFLVNAQAKPEADLEALGKKLVDRAGRLATADGLSDAEVVQARAAILQMLGPVNLNGVPLPPGVSKTMARANLELQRLLQEIVGSDLDAYAKHVEALDAAAVRAAVGRHLTAKAACVVRIEPK